MLQPATPEGVTYGIPLRLRTALARLGGTFDVRRDERLFDAGTDSQFAYLIESGAIKLETTLPTGQVCVLEVLGAGDLLGESSLIGGIRDETATALVEGVIRQVPGTALAGLPGSAAVELQQYLAARMQEHRRLITLLTTAESEVRLAVRLAALCERFGVTRPEGTVIIDLRLTHLELGRMVGTTRSRVGIFLARFSRAGIVVGSSASRLEISRGQLTVYLYEKGVRDIAGVRPPR